jgi:predicted NAD/FAD-binding protein
MLAGALAGMSAPVAATRTTVERRQRRAGRRTVGIVGGGIAGVATAWLLDGDWDVVLFEADPILGGHAHTIDVDYRGRSVKVDVGAQFFAPGTHPSYSKLLELLGLFAPDDPASSPTLSVPLSLTVTAEGEPNPLLVSPYGPDRLWPLGESWNGPGLLALAAFIDEARRLERDDVDWSTTIEQWVEPMAIAREQKDRLIYPWLASLNNLDVEASKALSARAGVYFVSRVLPEDPLGAVTYYNSLLGLGGIVQRLADGCTTLTAYTSARVRHIAPVGRRYRIVADGDRHELVDRLVIATPPYIAAKLVRRLPGGERIGRSLAKFPYYSTTIQIHTDPVYVPAERRLWSFSNVDVRGGFGEASIWYGAIHPAFGDGSTVDIFKSWARERGRNPAELVYTQDFRHALPIPDFTRAQVGLERFQGRRNLWFAGSHCLEVDSQDTALRSAMRVADALAPDAAHYLALKQMLSAGSSGAAE